MKYIYIMTEVKKYWHKHIITNTSVLLQQDKPIHDKAQR